ncbi:hypothetical protein VTL71DRAFT_7661 [Oculimacula yallundae]|uniref:Uncharacterized protein n=1 Tax=Oculimacula yallundae TaxID=86028 RepID=A0ABR4BXD3_9HELO
MMCKAEEVDPPWGSLPSERYILANWNLHSTETNHQQCINLARYFVRDKFPLSSTSDLPIAQIRAILSPWRPLSVRGLTREANPLHGIWLRTVYSSASYAVHEQHVRTMDWWSESGEEDRLLSDDEYFDFGDNWQRIFDLFPEILMPGSAWESVTTETRDSQNATIRQAATDVKKNLDGLLTVLSGQAIEADAEGVVQEALEWARWYKTSEREAHDYVLREWTDVLHRAFVIGFIVVEDEESLRTGKVLVVFLDERGRSVREKRCDVDNVNGFCPLWDEGAEFDGGQWEDGTIGKDYLEGGERWSVTKGDVGDLMPLW